MGTFRQFVTETIADGAITDAELPLIRERLYADGQLDLDDVKLLVELYCEATEHSPAFQELFYSVLEQVLLEDGELQPSEQFYLLKMTYSDRHIPERERAFLTRLRNRLPSKTPDVEALFETALAAPATNWCVGGRESH